MRPRAGRLAAGAVALAAVGLVVVAFLTRDDRPTGRDRASSPERRGPLVDGTPPSAPPGTTGSRAVEQDRGPARHLGPQGRVGQFVAVCAYSHTAATDPIVHPGHRGASHSHDFYGARNVNESSTAGTLRRSATTCDKEADTAAYWHPTLYDHGRRVVPRSIAAYYRAAPDLRPTRVRPYPPGLAMLAGHPEATSAPSDESAGWTCGVSTDLRATPPHCPVGAPLHLVLTFPDCWDGERRDSSDHRSHVGYSSQGSCGPDHPVAIPQLTVSVAFPIWGTGHRLRFSSGPIWSAHGDFLNGWRPAGLAREIDHCIHRDVVCDLASNRAEDPLFQHR